MLANLADRWCSVSTSIAVGRTENRDERIDDNAVFLFCFVCNGREGEQHVWRRGEAAEFRRYGLGYVDFNFKEAVAVGQGKNGPGEVGRAKDPSRLRRKRII